MNRTQAINKLRPSLGKHLAWRENPKALAGDDLEEAKQRYADAIAVKQATKEARDARHKAVLDGDAEYQRLKKAATEAYEACDKAGADSRRRRITVGTRSDVGGLGFFHVRAEGDNWQEVVDILTKKKVAA